MMLLQSTLTLLKMNDNKSPWRKFDELVEEQRERTLKDNLVSDMMVLLRSMKDIDIVDEYLRGTGGTEGTGGTGGTGGTARNLCKLRLILVPLSMNMDLFQSSVDIDEKTRSSFSRINRIVTKYNRMDQKVRLQVDKNDCHELLAILESLRRMFKRVM